MTKQTNTPLALHNFYKKFPHLFKKSSNPKSLSVSLSATREKVEEAFRILKLSEFENPTDLAGFKKLFSLIGDDNYEYDGIIIGDGLFSSKNANVKEMATEPTTTAGDDEESVRFDFGDDYGNRREFAELRKDLLYWNLWKLRVPRRACRVSQHGEEDIFELCSTEEMLKEFEKNGLF